VRRAAIVKETVELTGLSTSEVKKVLRAERK